MSVATNSLPSNLRSVSVADSPILNTSGVGGFISVFPIARTMSPGSIPPAAAGPPLLTHDVKQQIADEVRNQIALENSEAQQNAQNQDPNPASSGINRLLTDGHPHTFVVGGALDVVDASSGAECALSDGDALELASPPPADATQANLVVLSSKGGPECRKGSSVTVGLNDLQEMQNHMREMIDQGMQQLQAQQGKGGLPTLPPSAASAPVDSGVAQGAPPADPKDAAAISQQLAQADEAEKEVVAESAQPGSPIAAPAPVPSSKGPMTIELGQTIDQVTAQLGAPMTVVELGVGKKKYIYQNMKITFKDGKVSDVE